MDQIEITFKHKWLLHIHPTAGAKDGFLRVAELAMPWVISSRNHQKLINRRPWELVNAYELINVPGEWYLDASGAVDGSGACTLYYKPRKGEDMAKVQVTIGTHPRLVSLIGTPERKVEGPTFEGITFRNNTWVWDQQFPVKPREAEGVC